MREITKPEMHYIDRQLFLTHADSYLKGNASEAEKRGAQELVTWIIGAVELDLREDTKVMKVPTAYGLYCSHCGTTCAGGDRFCRQCGGRFV